MVFSLQSSVFSRFALLRGPSRMNDLCGSVEIRGQRLVVSDGRVLGRGVGMPGCGGGVSGSGIRMSGCGIRVPGCGTGMSGCGIGMPECGIGVPQCGIRMSVKHSRRRICASREGGFAPFNRAGGGEGPTCGFYRALFSPGGAKELSPWRKPWVWEAATTPPALPETSPGGAEELFRPSGAGH
jgi:hypothetical protein